MKKPCFLLFLIVLIACSKRTPQLNEDERYFAGALVDVYLANGLSNQINLGDKDSLRNALTVQVLKTYDMDTTQFYEELNRLEQDPAKFKILFDTVTMRLEKMRDH